MRNYSLFFLSSVFLWGCSFEPYYQFYTVEAAAAAEKSNRLVFSDERCELKYNLWSQGGTSSFLFKNNTESDLIILRSRSFWVMNGEAFPLYQGRKWGQAQSQSLGVNTRLRPNLPTESIEYIGSIDRSLSSVERNEPTEQVIPKGLYVQVASAAIQESIVEKCALLNWRATKDPLVQNYGPESSPLQFHHLVRYSNGTDTFEIASKFHVRQIKTVREREAMELVSLEPCSNAGYGWGYVRKLKYLGPATFYLKFELN
jgi:hypothetical protein